MLVPLIWWDPKRGYRRNYMHLLFTPQEEIKTHIVLNWGYVDSDTIKYIYGSMQGDGAYDEQIELWGDLDTSDEDEVHRIAGRVRPQHYMPGEIGRPIVARRLRARGMNVLGHSLQHILRNIAHYTNSRLQYTVNVVDTPLTQPLRQYCPLCRLV